MTEAPDFGRTIVIVRPAVVVTPQRVADTVEGGALGVEPHEGADSTEVTLSG